MCIAVSCGRFSECVLQYPVGGSQNVYCSILWEVLRMCIAVSCGRFSECVLQYPVGGSQNLFASLGEVPFQQLQPQAYRTTKGLPPQALRTVMDCHNKLSTTKIILLSQQ